MSKDTIHPSFGYTPEFGTPETDGTATTSSGSYTVTNAYGDRQPLERQSRYVQREQMLLGQTVVKPEGPNTVAAAVLSPHAGTDYYETFTQVEDDAVSVAVSDTSEVSSRLVLAASIRRRQLEEQELNLAAAVADKAVIQAKLDLVKAKSESDKAESAVRSARNSKANSRAGSVRSDPGSPRIFSCEDHIRSDRSPLARANSY